MFANRIDCPTCERMGRVTVIMPDGHLSTATCATCHGEGRIIEHYDPECSHCAHATAGAIPATPMF